MAGTTFKEYLLNWHYEQDTMDKKHRIVELDFCK